MMASFVLNMATMIVSSDGLITETETDFIASLGIKLGLWDSTYASMMRTVQTAHGEIEAGHISAIEGAQNVVEANDDVVESYTQVKDTGVEALADVERATGGVQAKLIDASLAAGGLKSELDGLPRDIQINILINERRKYTQEGLALTFEEMQRQGVPGGYQHGGFIPTGGSGIVGEAGMERVVAVPGGVQVQPISNIYHNYNMTINTQATAGTYAQDILFAQAQAQ
jgi:hypothetical protein